jgi:hypothetical protein
MPQRGYLLVAKANHTSSAGVAGFFWEAMKTLTPEMAVCYMECLPEQL